MVQLAPVPAWGRVGIGQDLARGKPGQVQHACAQGKCASRRRGPLRHPAPANGTATVKRTAPIAFGSCTNHGIETPPLYGVHCVKRYLLCAAAVCWTKSGPASLLSGRRSAAPPCIRSALNRVPDQHPTCVGHARPGGRDQSFKRHCGPGGTPVHADPASSQAACCRCGELGQIFSTAPSGTVPQVT